MGEFFAGTADGAAPIGGDGEALGRDGDGRVREERPSTGQHCDFKVKYYFQFVLCFPTVWQALDENSWSLGPTRRLSPFVEEPRALSLVY